MSDNSKIEWTDATWNPVRGCTKISPGCTHCYASTFAERFRGVKGHPYEQGFDLRLVPEKLTEPFFWTARRRVFHGRDFEGRLGLTYGDAREHRNCECDLDGHAVECSDFRLHEAVREYFPGALEYYGGPAADVYFHRARQSRPRLHRRSDSVACRGP